MKFYTSIAPYYDHIFPFKPMQKKFVLTFCKSAGEGSLLDIGCGTGDLIISLADNFDKLAGIDPDGEMLRISRQRAEGKRQIKERGVKKEGLRNELVFKKLGMLDLSGNFEPASFDIILCFGNTAVHLGNEEEVIEFLRQTRYVLKPGGKLLIQIINYDRIIDQNLEGLPTIENEEIRFERIYKYDKDPVKVDFNTKLTVKSTGQIIENSVPLLAMRPGRLRDLISEAGFTDIEEFGNFKGEAFTKDSQPYIVKAE